MRCHFTERFRRSFVAAPRIVQKAFDKQSRLLLENMRHPSLRVKKYDESRDLWQARVNDSWRFYFIIIEFFMNNVNIDNNVDNPHLYI